ncbi:hypothetical protein pb186bvf_010455 [Paramecium bursaria]
MRQREMKQFEDKENLFKTSTQVILEFVSNADFDVIYGFYFIIDVQINNLIGYLNDLKSLLISVQFYNRIVFQMET